MSEYGPETEYDPTIEFVQQREQFEYRELLVWSYPTIEQLNALGGEGWRLCAVIDRPADPPSFYIFVRAKPPE